MLTVPDSPQPAQTQTAEAAAIALIGDSGRDGFTFHVPPAQLHGQREVPRGRIVLYSRQWPERPLEFGYAFIKAQGTAWRGRMASFAEVPTQGHGVVAYGVDRVWWDEDDFVLVFGLVLNPEVREIDVTLTDGQTQRGVPTDGMFGVVSTLIAGVCEVRAMDATGRVLQRFDARALNATVRLPACTS